MTIEAVKIHDITDINNTKTYIAEDISKVKKEDLPAYKAAIGLGMTITMGKVIAEPIII